MIATNMLIVISILLIVTITNIIIIIHHLILKISLRGYCCIPTFK